MEEKKELEQEIHNEAMKLRTSPCYEELEAFARHFVEWGKNHHGHVSNELEEAASDYDSRHCALYAEDDEGDIVEITEVREIAFINGALWQKQQMMKDAVDGHIRRNKYTKKNVLNGLDVVCEAVQKFKDGDKLKIIFVKEE